MEWFGSPAPREPLSPGGPEVTMPSCATKIEQVFQLVFVLSGVGAVHDPPFPPLSSWDGDPLFQPELAQVNSAPSKIDRFLGGRLLGLSPNLTSRWAGLRHFFTLALG